MTSFHVMEPRVSSSRCDPELAEVIGLLIGDGCVSGYFSSGRYRLEVAFTGNLSESEYYRWFVKRTIERYFPLKGRLILRGDNTVRLHYVSTRLARFMLSIGLPLGKKTDAHIPRYILESGQILHFLRGFYHAEGSIYRRYSKPYGKHRKVYSDLMVVQFRCKLKTLMAQVRSELVALGLNPNKLSKEDGVYTFRIASQKHIQLFMDVVEPKLKTTAG
jgi:hypothetical protein